MVSKLAVAYGRIKQNLSAEETCALLLITINNPVVHHVALAKHGRTCAHPRRIAVFIKVGSGCSLSNDVSSCPLSSSSFRSEVSLA